MNEFKLPAHSYDSILSGSNPMALRLNDSLHQNIRTGDMVHFEGQGSILDRQKYKVLGRMDHPSLGHAIKSIHGSNLSTRDKIRLTNAFTGFHGQPAANHSVVTLQLEHHGSSTLSSPVNFG